MKQNLVMAESWSKNAPPTATLSYTENVHEFLGGLFSITTRIVHNRCYLLLGFRLPKKVDAERLAEHTSRDDV